MNTIIKSTIIGCCLTFAGIGISSAQHHHGTPCSQTMIRSLSGGHDHPHPGSHTLRKRSIQISTHVQPKGCSGHQHRPLSYHVDSSCQLCTSQVQFIKNSTALANHQSYQYLHNLAYALNSPQLHGQRFVIEGHASAEGGYSSNLSLSQRRANAIYDFLVQHGVCPTRLLSVGHGESQARYPSSAPEYLRAEDRRVIIFKMAG